MGFVATALYRRYRPETFAEMIGQSQVTEPLMTALRSGKVGHAYLFSGPRGCGKTTSARVLARCLNCAEGPTDSPCGTCPSCVELSRDGGGSLDVIEIDAASHGGVDDARDLRERAIFAPVRDRYKIFIIDEAHMVTKEGFNALLKIVEEPPEHVKFVFATTEPEKVIGTIRSRTHHYPFRLIAPAALLEYVLRLANEEGITTDEGVLPLVIRAGGGSARDTLSILDQLIAGSAGSHIDYERAVGLLGYTHGDLLDEMIDALGAADTAAGILAVDRVIQTGQDPRRFVEDLLERLRDLIIVQATDIDGATAVLRGMPEEQLQRMVQQTANFPRGALSRIADTVSDALDNMTGATAPRLHLELMVARTFVELNSAAAAPTQAPQARIVPATQGPARSQLSAHPASTAAPEGQSSRPERQPTSASHAGSSPKPAPTATDPAAAIRSARAFLAGTGQPPAPAPAPAPTRETPPPAPVPETPSPAQAAAPEQPDHTVFGTDAVNDAWGSIAEALGTRTPEAGRAAGETEVLGVDGVTLHLGFQNDAHLSAFKQHCAGIIRTGLEERFGVTVQYQPWIGADRIAEGRQLFGGSSPISSEPVPPQPTEPAPVADEPPYDEPPFEDPGPARAPANPIEPETEQALATPDSPDSPDSPESPESPPSSPSPPSVPSAPESVTSLAAPTDAPAPATTPASSEPAPRNAPTFTRYGESVVREVLGAKFVGEQPLP